MSLVYRAPNRALNRFVYLKTCSAVALACAVAFTTISEAGAAPAKSDAAQSQSWRKEQSKAVKMARAGHIEAALQILQRLYNDHPDDPKLAHDIMSVSGWAGHDDSVVDVYEKLPDGKKPDYVLGAVGLSYRHIKHPEQALEVYRKGLTQSPGSITFAVGEIRSLMDAKRFSEAQKAGEANMAKHGVRLDVLVATSEAAVKGGDIYQGLIYAERAHDLAPGNRDALRSLIYAEDGVGAPQLALSLADKSKDAVSEKEHRQLEGDVAAFNVRWGTLEPAGEPDRYAETDQAITLLERQIDNWSQLGPDAQDEVLRARMDRIVALRNRSRMKEAVGEYEKLRTQGVEVPAYVLSAVGDAYLYLHEPQKAREVYQQSLKKNSGDFDTRRQLFFAYVETDDFSNAYKVIDKLREEQPVWLYLKGETERLENPQRATADIDIAAARLYGENLSDADKRLSAMTAAAPYDPRKRYALGSLYLTRGWPRDARKEFEAGTRIQEGHDADNETGVVLADLDMRNYPDAGKRVASLMQRYPENLDVQRANHAWNVYNEPELTENAYYNFRPSNSAQGGAGWGTATQVYSSPIHYNWRIFAEEDFQHEVEPTGEGKINYQRSAVGVEYRDTNLTATLAPSFNRYHTSDRFGLEAAADWAFNDRFSVGAGYELFSPEIPLRALNSNVTADKYDIHAEWRQSESRDLRLDTEMMPFSDGNLHTGELLSYTQRLFSLPHFKFDGVLDLSSSQDTKDEARNYFNPRLDVEALAGLQVSQTLYRSYDTIWEHSFVVTPGYYWQQDFGHSKPWVISYNQTLHANNNFEGKLGVSFARQAYDGISEDNVSLLLNLVGHF